MQCVKMAKAITAIAASLNPGKWTKDLSPEKSLKTFTRYMIQFKRWVSVFPMEDFTDKQK